MNDITHEYILQRGLELLCGFDARRQCKVKLMTNQNRFRSHYGSEPIVYAALWKTIQAQNVDQNANERKLKLDHFLMALFFLKCYPKESHLAGKFNVSEKTARDIVWFHVGKIQELKAIKVRSINIIDL